MPNQRKTGESKIETTPKFDTATFDAQNYEYYYQEIDEVE